VWNGEKNTKTQLRNDFADVSQCCTWASAGGQGQIKRVGGPGQLLLEGPNDVFHDVIFCKIYVFADSQRPRLLFPTVDYVPAVLTRLLAAFDCKPHEMVFKN